MADASSTAGNENTLAVDDVTVTEPGVIKRAIGAAAVGNITEWYDFGVYAYMEPTIKQVFFSDLPEPMGTIATFGLFAVAFLVRPFGGMFFGPLADRIGRNRVLSTTMIMMAIGTFCIGIIPDPVALGIGAPLLMLVARLLQGFSTGGEYGNAMTFIAEYAPDKRRGFFGSWLEMGTLVGYTLGATVVVILTNSLSQSQLLDWGWRVPFFVALPLGLIGLYLRLKLEDTPAYTKLTEEADERERDNKKSTGMRDILKLWPALLVCMGLVLAWNVTNYVLTAYFPTYLTEVLPKQGAGVDSTTSSILQIVMMLVLVGVVTQVGRLSDRIGRRPIVLGASIALLVLSVPATVLLRSHGPVLIFCGLMIAGLMLVCFSATMPATLPAMFPTRVRAGSLSVSFNISVSLFGGTVGTVVGTLVAVTGDLNWPGYYMMIAGAIGVVAILCTRESAGKSLPGSGPAVASNEEAQELVAAAK